MKASSTPILTAFKTSPDRGRGLARDMRVRWALEEVQKTYDVRLLTFDELKKSANRELQPFGQIPSYQEGDLVLFETGAIVLHIAETNAGLLPIESHARARAIAGMFAALNTIEQPIVERSSFVLLEKEKSWFNERLPILDERAHVRLRDLAHRLGDNEWLEGSFSAADILMVTVLRRLDGSGLLEHHPKLMAYIARGEARPAYQRAFAAQLAVYKASLDE